MGKVKFGMRDETDSFGKIEVPADKYWGAQTQRSILNFQIGDERLPSSLIRSLGIVKRSAAVVNLSLNSLEKRIAEGIILAAQDIIDGKMDDNFPLVIWQTGSGTQSNMNANEVIANVANERMGNQLGSKAPVHPNDHCNKSQSTNDSFPTAMHIAIVEEVHQKLLPSMNSLKAALARKSSDWQQIIKVGRTHLRMPHRYL